MAKSNSFHVRPTESNNWEVRVEGGSEASSIHPSQAEAADRARELAKGSVNGKVVIHGKDGAIRREFSYGPDPRAATNVASNRFRQCYISAPLGTNISLLRHTFEERDVACIDQGDFRPGVPLLQEIERALDRSDFVCAVVPRATSHESVLFEMGVARGKHRPILVFADFGTDLPYFLQGIPYSRASLKDKAAIEGHVDAFLEHSSADTVRGTVDSIGASAEQPKRVDTSWAALALTASEAGEAVALEAIVSRLFQDAGMVTSEPLVHGTGERGNTLRPDFALWNDEHADGFRFLPTLLLVECKNWSAAVGSQEVAYFAHRLRQRGCDHGFLIAANGVTGNPHDLTQARFQIASALSDGIRIMVITNEELVALEHTADLVALSKRKLCQLVASGTAIT